jgi:hypothetical protein
VRFLPLLAAWACGCEAPPDPARALREFAEASAEPVYEGLWLAVEADAALDLWNLADDTTAAGWVEMPSATGDRFGVDGELSADWTLAATATDPPTDGERAWDWAFEVDYARLSLPSCEVSGAGSWTVAATWYDIGIEQHAWEGELTLGDLEALDVTFEALHSGNLHWVRGRIGDTEVDWENPDPDLP